MSIPDSNKIVLLIPVFNDWESVSLLLPAIDHALERYPTAVHVLLVDDGSVIPPPDGLVDAPFQHIVEVDILHLRRNLGHQRAIAVGLVHCGEHVTHQAVIVMDADGEDRPQDVPRLLAEFERLGRREIVFGARTKRLETIWFRAFYHMYRLAHYLLTGVSVRVGNFSILPREAVARLVVVSDLWNHYAAAVFRSKIPYSSIPLPRGARLRGHSTMSFFSLLVHGLSAVSVFGDMVSVRLLAAVSVALAGVVGGLILGGGSSLRLWVVLVLLAQAFMTALVLVFATIGARSRMSFLPLRDAHHFVLESRPVYVAHARVQLHRIGTRDF